MAEATSKAVGTKTKPKALRKLKLGLDLTTMHMQAYLPPGRLTALLNEIRAGGHDSQAMDELEYLFTEASLEAKRRQKEEERQQSEIRAKEVARK
ncbi:unnamed protein product [Protopolystoma xenopodis]|uniref:Uncharacterized protein n=1 Tax=Protopolystoma xenopodis TaxID=117903 RepID=A0A448XRI1_9PLAT|nr:unnamed protein product [Protopolystoma xenopodis]